MEAASGGHVEVARALLDHGAGVNTHSNDSKDSTSRRLIEQVLSALPVVCLENGNDSKQHKTDEMHTGKQIIEA